MYHRTVFAAWYSARFDEPVDRDFADLVLIRLRVAGVVSCPTHLRFRVSSFG